MQVGGVYYHWKKAIANDNIAECRRQRMPAPVFNIVSDRRGEPAVLLLSECANEHQVVEQHGQLLSLFKVRTLQHDIGMMDNS